MTFGIVAMLYPMMAWVHSQTVQFSAQVLYFCAVDEGDFVEAIDDDVCEEPVPECHMQLLPSFSEASHAQKSFFFFAESLQNVKSFILYPVSL